VRIRRKKESKQKRQSSSEIKRIVAIAKKSTPDEFKQYLASSFEKDLLLLKRLVTERRKSAESIRKGPEIQPLLKKIEKFYADLINDEYIKKNLSLFKGTNLENYKLGQAREEQTSFLKELETGVKDYKEFFHKANRAYTINYEALCNTYLIPLAQKVSGRSIRNKSKVIDTLSSYKNRKHEELFKSLIPQIRNSVSHEDSFIDPKLPKITFYDRKKPPLTFTLEEYANIVWEGVFLSLAFDIAEFDLKSGILDILIESIDIVRDYATKHDLKFVRGKEAPLSLLDWALLIKTGRISSIPREKNHKYNA